MKNSWFFFFFLLHSLFLFGQENDFKEKKDILRCVVVKIDSIENYYIIDVLSNEIKYKILSRKVHSDCYTLYEGGIFDFCIYPTIPEIASDQVYFFGIDTNIELNWGANLYVAQELCGLCYETDSANLNQCKRLVKQQEEFESAIITIYFFYKTKKSNCSIKDFYKKNIENAMPFVLFGTKTIPIYFTPKKGEVKYELFNDTINQKVFYGKVFYQYKNYYLIQGYYNSNINIKILGWIDKRQLINKLNFKNKN